MAFWRELSRRNVYRVGVAYLVAAWLVIQVVDTVSEPLVLPESLDSVVIVLLAIGFPFALIFAWAFELTPQGIRRTESSGSSIRTPRLSRRWDFAIIGVLAAAVIYFAFLDGSPTPPEDTTAAVSDISVTEENDEPLTAREIEESKAAVDDAILAGDWAAAYSAAVSYQQMNPTDPSLDDLWSRVSRITGIETDPAGATVYRRLYESADDDWVEIGVTPLEAIRFPLGLSLLRFEMAGYRSATVSVGSGMLTDTRLQVATGEVSHRDGRGVPSRTIRLDPLETLPEDMVRVSGWTEPIAGDSVRFNDFFLGRTEVTNAAYQEFVDDDGYQRQEYWEYPFLENGAELSFEQAMARFVDTSGRPGPMTWVAGHYPDGQEEYPVAGVSWYEAAAFARWAGRDLPTIHHWRRAVHEAAMPWLLSASNLESDGPRPVGTGSAISWFGNHDLAGNVREWVFNASGDDRILMGGAWNEAQYYGIPTFHGPLAPMERSEATGFRLARLFDEPDALDQARRPVRANVTSEPIAPIEVSEADFEAYRQRYAYDVRKPLRATTPSREQTTRYWTVEFIEFDAAYPDERVGLNLYLPTDCARPYQTVIYWPDAGSTVIRSTDDYQIPLHFLLKNCRAIAFPILKGTFNRELPYPSESLFGPGPQDPRFIELTIQRVQDIQRTLDYLGTRPDIDDSSYSYFGYSWGSNMGPIVLAVEPRFKLAVFYVAGYLLPDPRVVPAANPATFMSRVRQPVLQLNGEYDGLFAREANATPFFEAIGSAEKEHVVVWGAHFVSSQTLIGESLRWLEQHLGLAN